MNSKIKALDVHHNNCASNDPCALCGARTDPECSPELFLAETEALVCYDCGRQHDADLVDMLFTYRERLHGQQLTKDELLTKYAQRPMTRFRQYDAFVAGPNDRHDIMRPDSDGRCLVGGETHELMHGADVRVLVSDNTSKREIPALIRKLAY
jgi:hypothetical protein